MSWEGRIIEHPLELDYRVEYRTATVPSRKWWEERISLARQSWCEQDERIVALAILEHVRNWYNRRYVPCPYKTQWRP